MSLPISSPSSLSSSPSLSSLTSSPGSGAPPTCEVPHFAPLRVGGARYRLRRLVRCRRRAVAAGLAVTATALVAAGPREAEPGPGAQRPRGHPVAEAVPERQRAVEMVAAPVRIADGDAVGLLRPGDRVDVIAAEGSATGGGDARVVARAARVTRVPEASVSESGALVVLSVPRTAAARLAGAGATSRLAVTLCRP
ncbi:hypothetical protein [Streptomyces spongiae]|uniref:Flp pilus assembly protein RcpC/CpaB domain-containing protein n=1 Tax=Streptomyces spongiae TaxID=565072 RepID=A0A5N8XNN7_9ACTN|nr:hypothetical protein [Streptomyces spongiae]MPY60927.1 hypothetical protein [Streptomyces spongiae]